MRNIKRGGREGAGRAVWLRRLWPAGRESMRMIRPERAGERRQMWTMGRSPRRNRRDRRDQSLLLVDQG